VNANTPENKPVTAAIIKKCFETPSILTLDFQNLQSDTFTMWLLTLMTRSGAPPGASTLNGHRSGLNHYKQHPTRAYEKELGVTFQGLIKSAVSRKPEGRQG
jgi:hypothetical protein